MEKTARDVLINLPNDELIALALKRGLDPSKYGFDETNSEILWLEKLFKEVE